MKKLCLGGQSIIEYLLILVLVGIASMIFARTFIYDEHGKFKLFSGYVVSVKARLQN